MPYSKQSGLAINLPRRVYVNDILIFEGIHVPFQKFVVQYRAFVKGSDVRDGYIIYRMKSPLTAEEIRVVAGVV